MECTIQYISNKYYKKDLMHLLKMKQIQLKEYKKEFINNNK